MNAFDEAVSRYEAGETWDNEDEVVEVTVRRPLDKVVPIRLSSGAWEALRKEAIGLGIGPSTLARMWILERLKAESRKQKAEGS